MPQVAIKQSKPLQMCCNGAALLGVALLLLACCDDVIHAQQRAVDDQGPETVAPAINLLHGCKIVLLRRDNRDLKPYDLAHGRTISTWAAIPTGGTA